MTSTPRAYFDAMYATTPDPWHFATSDYERRKYELTMASLPASRYRSAFEPGCSIGVLSELLAQRCDRLLAADIVPEAVMRASERLRRFPGARVEERLIPGSWPREEFDLVVLSEIAYYFDEAELRAVIERVALTTTPGAHIVGVHWRGDTDYPLSGDRAHEVIDESQCLRALVHHEEAMFVLDVWERVP